MLLRAQLHIKINSLAKELGAVKQDGVNDFDHYSFISYQYMDSLLNTLLPKHNLAISPQGDTFLERDITTSKGKPATRSCVTMLFDVIDLETGYSEIRKFFGADQDTKGKSLGQAITECDKRFKFKTFRVSSKEADPDSNSLEHGSRPEFTEAEKTANWKTRIDKLALDTKNANLDFLEDVLEASGTDTLKEAYEVAPAQRKYTLDLCERTLNKTKEVK